MHQNAGIGNIICMIILNLEIIYLNWCFQDLVLNLLNNDIFAIDQNQNIAGTEVNRIRPALDGGVEGVAGCGYDLLAVYENVDQFIGFIDIRLHDPFEGYVSRFLIPCPDKIS